MDRPVTLAVITGAHGVTGEVRLKLFGEGVASLKRFRAFNDSALTLKKLRDDGKGGAIARFAEVTDRNMAEALRGTELTVPRADLPPLDAGEYYHADLIGLAVVAPDGAPLGTIIAIPNYGAGDLLEIAPPAGPTLLVPFTRVHVPDIDLAAGRLSVVLPEEVEGEDGEAGEEA